MSSESENDISATFSPERLGTCEACNANPAKYTCPRCEVKTCTLACLNLHKTELKCDGKRDKTKYIPLVKMTKMDLMNDNYFLEECTKFVEDRKRDRNKSYTRYNKNLPPPLFRLRQAAYHRGTALRFLLPNFTKHQKNTSQLDYKTGVIFWRVEWCFPNGNEALLFTDDRVSEKTKLYEAVDKYLQHEVSDISPSTSKLMDYQSRGIGGLQLLLKAEGIKCCKNRFYPLDINNTIGECVAGKTVVEYPLIYVVFKDQLEKYNVVDSDDDNATAIDGESPQSQSVSTDVIAGRLDQMNIDRNAENKKQKMFSGNKAHQKPVQLNFLFSDDSLLNQPSSSDSDQGQVTEEENDMVAPKRSRITDLKNSR